MTGFKKCLALVAALFALACSSTAQEKPASTPAAVPLAPQQVVEPPQQVVEPPQQVVDAFDNVLRARQDEQRARNEAEAYRNDILPRARGDAVRIVQQAEAYREQVVAQAQGDANRFLAVLQSYRTAPAVTAQRLYLETMEQVLTGVNKVIIESAVGGPGVVPYLPLGELQRRPAAPASGTGLSAAGGR